ncbi:MULTISPECIES: response regulator transcription factor [Auritidibacter]|uniref:Response regulator transcription factor n=1 Tax=Auritidibacter ignavus TaxID=678932 RepID=A0AAJ6AG05_9MICC|nr:MULTISPECIES: response regulator transcription factor [Auritidibacter]PXA80599.1 DNA-binding response regulator [Auritidibacter sp. NML120636]WGH85700.1 response regulator transcription factor [Auritidibacter ignavus]WGH87987.1 response regulator transcription factor [Auritidibacter ignavus]WGH92646.1 response regulator transcription factor [Auritidibacter ignavus]
MIRILLADDQLMFRRALSTYIELTTNFEVVAEASDADQALHSIRHTQPDVALLDIHMPGDGLMVAQEVARWGAKTRVIMCTTFDRPGYVLRAWQIGCAGFVTKDKEPSALISVIRRVAAGERVFDPQLLQEARTWGANPLTARERDVLRASADGVAVRQIAARLFLSNGTIRNHLSSAIGKTGASSRAQAVERARERGWL